MEIITAKKLEEMTKLNKKKMEQLFPEIVERLVLADNSSVKEPRFPSRDDIWAPGYDGVVSCDQASEYVCMGKSVWEFGSSDDSLKKINDDYNKRTNNSLGIDKSETGFYLVIPKIWAYKTALTSWEANHTDWKFTKVYDAVILCKWINKYPVIVSWLLEEIYGDTHLSFSSLAMEWERFSQKTNPALVKEMFTQCREDQVNQFIYKLNNENNDIRIKASTRIDSVGFALAVMGSQKFISDKCLVVNNVETFRRIAELSEGIIILLTYAHEGELYNSKNRIVTCYNKEATSISDAIELPLLTKSAYESALNKMGIPNGEIVNIFAVTHGNLRALIRRIKGNVIEEKPDWADENSIDALIPLVLLRTIDKNKDKEIVEKLANCNFECLEQQYYRLSKLEDAPLKIVHNHYVIVSFEEAWATLGLSTTEQHFDKFVRLIEDLFDSISQTGQFAGRYYHECKDIIRKLFWNFIYYSYEKDEESKLESSIKKILPWIYNSHTMGYVVENLSFLAESTPQVVMDFLSDDYKSEESVIKYIFEGEDNRNLYCGILFALDCLAIHRETLPEVSRILFDLFLLKKEYRYSNSPEESLLNALCLWRCEGTVTISDKEKIIIHLLNKSPQESIELFSKLIGKDSYYRVERIGERKTQAEKISIKELLLTKERIIEVLFSKAIESRSALLVLSVIKNYYVILPVSLEKYSEKFKLEYFDEQEVSELNYWLRERVFNIKRYGWDREAYIEALEKWIKATEYKDEVKKFRWVFKNVYDCPAEELLTNIEDYRTAESERYNYRKKIFSDLLKKNGEVAIDAVSKMITNELYWGYLFAEVVPEEEIMYAFKILFDSGKYLALAKALDEAKFDLSKEFFNKLGKERIKVISKLDKRVFLSLLDEEEKHIFWSKKEMFNFDQKDYDALLKYHPQGIIPWLYKESRENASQCIDIAKDTLKQISKNSTDESINHYEIEIIIKGIDQVYYSEEWAELCLDLMVKDIITEYPSCVCKMIFYRPELIKRIIEPSYVAKRRFEEKYVLPKNAFEDYGSFKFFFDSIRQFEKNEGNYMEIIATLLGKNIKGKDGYFPHEFVRLILEEYDSRELDTMVAFYFENLRKIRTVTDGHDQKEKAKEFSQIANEFLIDYPHSAYVLNTISEIYKEDGKQDYINSEVRIY